MATSPTTHKVVFSLLAILLTLYGLVLSQAKAEALTGFIAKSTFGYPTIAVRRVPSSSGVLAYNLPNGAPININCIVKDGNNNWLQLTDGNFLPQNLSSYPTSYNLVPICSNTKLYADRTLLQASGPAVYIIQFGRILWVPNEQTLNTCLGGVSKVVHITDTELNTAKSIYPNGGTASCPVSYSNGTTLLAESSGTVLVVSNGALYGVPNPETLVACLGGWSAVRRISDAEMAWANASYPYVGTYACPYSLPGGSKLLAPSGTVFYVNNGRSYGMPSAQVLITCYGGWSGVRSASQVEIDIMLVTYPYAGAAGCATPPPATVSGREQRAIDWAKSQLGSTYWNGMCELMVEQAYGTRGRFASALSHANYETSTGQMHTGDGNVPAGALAYFGAASVNGYYGHVMISIGGGQFITNGYTYNGRTYGAYITTLSSISAGPYIGWAYADSSWAGR